MAGGLLQLVSYGVQNKYLTFKPEITFFKIAYFRYTNFGKENLVLNYDQVPEFNKKISFNIPNNGDLLTDLTLHFKFDSFKPNLNNLNESLKILLENKINILKEELRFLESNRNNLKIYNNLIFGALKIIEKYESTLNISLSLFNNLIASYQKKIILDFNNIKDLITPRILENSNIFKFLLEDNLYKNIDELIINKNNIKNYLTKEFRIINNRIKNRINEIENLENKPILYKWKKNLVNKLVQHVELQIDGETIDKLTMDDIELYFQHHYTIDEKNKFYDLINGKEYDEFDLYLPLNFWFKDSYGLGIPIISLRYSSIKIIITLNSIENLFDLLDLEEIYNDLLIKKYEYENVSYEVFNNLVIIDNIIYDTSKTIFNNDTNEIIMKTDFLYKENLMDNMFIDDESANLILDDYGSEKNNKLSLNYDEFKIFIENLSNLYFYVLPIELNLNRFEISSNYNLLSGDIYCEYIYLDEIEREKFANNTLNYIIKLHSTNNFNITDLYFNKNLEIENYVSEIFWFLQEKSNLQGSNLYSPNYDKILPKKYIENFQLVLEGYKLFHEKNSPEYFNYVLPYQYLNHQLENDYFYYSFALYPEENQPSGGLSFGDISGKQMIVNLKDLILSEENPVILKIFYKKISILQISKGKGKLAFYNKS